MGLRLEQRLVLRAPPDRVWAVLTDPYQVASCLPGAAITERVDDRTYRGSVSLRVGPMTAGYRGTIRFERLDPERREAELVGQGLDPRGKGGAEMRMLSRLRPTAEGTEVTVASEISITGLLAQLGRGMLESVSNQIFAEFATALERKLAGTDADDRGASAESKPLDGLSLGLRAVGETLGRGVRRVLGDADQRS